MTVTPLFALFDSAAALVVGLLAVAGGFLAGYLLTGAIFWLVCRQFTRKPPPAYVVNWIRAPGGVVGALLVAMLMFGPKGGTDPFGNPGSGSVGPVVPVPATIPAPPASKPEPTKPETKPEGPKEVGSVTLLGADRVRDDRFYRVGDERKALTLSELRDRLKASPLPKGPNGRPQLDVLIFQDSATDLSLQAAWLREWAESAGVVLSFKRLPGRVP